MTDREIKNMEKTLPHWMNGVPPVRTDEQKRLAEELACRSMINSILCYNGAHAVMGNQYMAQYLKSLGRDTVERLKNEQLADFQKAAVMRYVHWDSEGVSYDSIIWADEMAEKVVKLVQNELKDIGPENGIGYALPDGKYHIFVYADLIDDDKVVVLEPNKVVAGAHEPIFGDTFILAYGDIAALLKGLDWCFEQFAADKYGIVEVLRNAHERSKASANETAQEHDFVKD